MRESSTLTTSLSSTTVSHAARVVDAVINHPDGSSHRRTSFSVAGSDPDWLTCSQLPAPSRSCHTTSLWQSIFQWLVPTGVYRPDLPSAQLQKQKGPFRFPGAPRGWLTLQGWWRHSPLLPQPRLASFTALPGAGGSQVYCLINICVLIFISASASQEPRLQQLVPELGYSEETHYIWYTSIYKK